MYTNIDKIWVFALFSKCNNNITSFNLICSFLVIAMVWLTMAVFHWIYPGGPAWGKYRLTHIFSRVRKNNIIPGPRGWPVIGSMSLMTGLAHRKIADEAQSCKAKRLMALSLGETRVIVTCNHEVAREILHSPNFADRPIKESAYSLMFNRAIGFAPYGVYWRTLRRVASTHLFCPRQINASEAQRADIASQMSALFGTEPAESASRFSRFCPRDVLRLASLSNMMGLVFGKRYSLLTVELNRETVELKEMVTEGYDLLGMLNWGDHLPWLADFDLQRLRFRCNQLVPKVNRFVGRIIDEHRDQADPVQPNRDFVDVLLSLHGSDKISESDMIAVLWEMIFRGTDTVAVLIEWILARLVRHPDVQSKVHNELDNVVGRSRAITESDLGSLPYLTAVIKEVLRLHPPGPLLSWARLAIEDTIVDGCHVPAGTTAMVDMFAIARDPESWAEPEEFNPDRFLSSGSSEADFSVLGSDLRLAPFGSGRRACPGKALGLATVSFWVAYLLHEFEWVSSPSDATVDLSEMLKLSCEMAHPLTVEVRPRRG